MSRYKLPKNKVRKHCIYIYLSDDEFEIYNHNKYDLLELAPHIKITDLLRNLVMNIDGTFYEFSKLPKTDICKTKLYADFLFNKDFLDKS